MTDKPKTEAETEKSVRIPALFATIHFRSEDRRDGYTSDEIAAMNELANEKPESTSSERS